MFKKKKKVECNEVHNTVMKNKNMYTQCSQLYSGSIHKIIEHKDKGIASVWGFMKHFQRGCSVWLSLHYEEELPGQ